MDLVFTKMNGAGNDFILVDDRSGHIRFRPELVARLCHRQRGIGADGLLVLRPCLSERADWSWEFYNSDGSKADMCGNGARCFARFVQRQTGTVGALTFETGAGVIRAVFDGDLVEVNLTRPRDLVLDQVVPMSHGTERIHSLNTGVPHAVLFVDDADRAMVQTWGAEIRRHALFAPRGTNVNFVEMRPAGGIRVRTYERGVEGETLACGTGVTASALIAATRYGLGSPVKVLVQGGDMLEVGFSTDADGFCDVRLKGPADFVFEGRTHLDT